MNLDNLVLVDSRREIDNLEVRVVMNKTIFNFDSNKVDIE